MTRVLNTGVRGKTGVPLAELLTARDGVEVLGGSSDPSSVTLAGVQPVAFSWDDRPGWAAATDGVDAIYLVRPDRADAPELIGALLEGTGARVVLLSEREYLDPARADWWRRCEEAVAGSGSSWTALRPSWFMQVFADERFYRGELLEQGRLTFAGGGAQVAWIDARDIAAVAERALLDDDLQGQALELTGPEALTLPETAQALATALGRPVEHTEVSIDEAVGDLPAGFERDEFVWTLERLADGEFAGVTGVVEAVTGRPARSLAAFASADLR